MTIQQLREWVNNLPPEYDNHSLIIHQGTSEGKSYGFGSYVLVENIPLKECIFHIPTGTIEEREKKKLHEEEKKALIIEGVWSQQRIKFYKQMYPNLIP